ncbi:hypothetical protein [Cohnella cholangitidis]|uniref:Uncharacterized protein n=1 Tax=Cohnella cholangitidis TaxID=2598458 RepID=A0A7G5C2I1_9BACL|nr:hypothetical protein [Cohnella cholangitidis]QMV43415.1 hypothetical protein FPL14_21215 [Cohnella cholangitidis]
MKTTLQPFRSLAFILVLLGAFIMLSMPTMMIGDNVTTSSSTSLAHDVPNSVKATKRTVSLPSKMLLLSVLLLLAFHFRFNAYLPYRMPQYKYAFLPLVLVHVRKILLMPLKFTTSYERV